MTLHLQHHDPGSLLGGELHAILQRPYTKGRDIYDLLWFLSDPDWPPPNLKLLNNALRQTGWEGDHVAGDNSRELVRARLQGLVDVLERYDVRLVLDSGQECGSVTCEAWRDQIEEKEIPCRRAQSGMSVELRQGVRLQVLHPPAQLMTGTSSDSNNNSVVLRLEYGHFTMLLTGDVQWETEETLVASGQPLNSLVLKVPHHGADTSLTLPFLEAVAPEVAIIWVGADNSFGHPVGVTLEKLEEIQTYRTDQQGSVQLVTDGVKYSLHAKR